MTAAGLRPALVITRRELRDQLRDWRIIFPVVVLTLIFPWLMNFTASQAVSFVDRYGATLIGERLVPFLLLVVGFFPISVSLVIALESFVGEKERHSIEPLLSSPLSDAQIYLGKLLAAMAPPLFASYLGILVYLVTIYLRIGWQPPPILLVQVLLLTAVQVVVMVSGAVVLSSQTTSTRGANLLASFIIIPMSFLIQGESIIMFWAEYDTLWWIVLGELVIAGLLIRTGVSHFNREELLGRDLDSLNLKWGWRTFARAFRGGARNLFDWYRRCVWNSLWRLALPSAFMLLALLLGVWAGSTQASVLVLPLELLDVSQVRQGFVEGLEVARFFSISSVGMVWLHNLRAIGAALILGIFSFGVLGVIVLMLPFMLIGYFMASVAPAGIPPLAFLMAFILPHGVLEIPAIVLAGAAILRLGATLAAPARGRTIGEAWLHALADFARVMLAVIAPLLLAAAVLEVLVTPQVVAYIFGG